MGQYEFPRGFLWGVATAAYQIEGAPAEDGKGESIWDRFTHTPGNILNGDTGDVACDHYHRYRDDVHIMRDLGVTAYRFSISWPRVLPAGKGQVNRKGLDFYSRLVDLLLEADIKPAITLYHWDLPQALQDKGGWINRATTDYFAEYASIMFNELGDRVPMWITHNEPWATAYAGHALGVHAPGLKDLSSAIQVSHHLLLSHGKAVQAFRDLGIKGGKIGITLNLHPVYPASSDESDIIAARRVDGTSNRWFLDPIFKGTYPEDIWVLFDEKVAPPKTGDGDLELIGSPVDFLGVNYYFRNVIRALGPGDEGTASPVDRITGGALVRPEGKYTEMGWEVYPEGIYDLLSRIRRDYGDVPLYITENGAAYEDRVNEAGKIEDDGRLDYIKAHLIQVHRAIEDGVNVAGYFVWSLMDNFEWAYGYSKRFGLIYVDYRSPDRDRIWKKSAFWYRDVIKNNAVTIKD
ncbi:MAG TPA: beta-glucosidase [Firmicutes bacterium]|nr:beta-glucosidase [Bacillota bacterium]